MPFDKTDVFDRRLRIISALLTALERRGHKPASGTTGLWPVECVVGGQRLDFEVDRHPFRRKVPMTAKERKDPRNIATKTEWKWIEQGTDQLRLMVDQPRKRCRHEWSDRWGRPLEAQLGEAILAFEAIAKAAAAEAADYAEWHRRYQEAENRRARRLEREAERLRRWRELKSLAAQVEDARRLRLFLDAVEQRIAAQPKPPAYARNGLAAARRIVDAYDPLAWSDAGLFKTLFPRRRRRRTLEEDDDE